MILVLSSLELKSAVCDKKFAIIKISTMKIWNYAVLSTYVGFKSSTCLVSYNCLCLQSWCVCVLGVCICVCVHL